MPVIVTRGTLRRIYDSCVERLELLAVHIDEALKMSQNSDPPRQRLALLMLDSAAELMMFREVSYLLAMERYPRSMLALAEQVRRRGESNEWADEIVDKYRAQVLSPKKLRDINQHFDAKAKYLVANSLIDPRLARVLRKLHSYRNEAYHQDHLRIGSLRSAVSIYGYVSLILLRDLPVHAMSWTSRRTLTTIAGVDLSPSQDWSKYQSLIATSLLKRYRLDEPRLIGQSLADYLVSRLDEMEDFLSYVAGYYSDMSGEPWTPEGIFQLVQIPAPMRYRINARDCEVADVPLKWTVIDSWRRRASDLSRRTSDVHAFEAFADLEDQIETVEGQVQHLTQLVDEEIDTQIKEAKLFRD